MSCWIGAEFCSGQGPWHIENGELVNIKGGRGVSRKRIHLSSKGQGINRQRPDLGSRGKGRGIHKPTANIYSWFEALSERLKDVRVCCGDWTRVLGPSPTFALGMTGIFLDPPYSQEIRSDNLYRIEDDVSKAVREWCLENGDNPLLRIALCGYEGEHSMPDSWECYSWKANGGYGGQGVLESDPLVA